MRVIPAIDLQDGQCVRLYKGDFAKTTVYSDRPEEIAEQYSAFGTDDLHVVDLDGARSGRQSNEATIRKIAEQTTMKIQLGGGIRDERTIRRWFDAGVSRCVIGSLAVTEPDKVRGWIKQFGGERIVLALDVNIGETGVPLLTTHGWTRPSTVSLQDCIADFQPVGLQHVLCTDVSRDGAMRGPNTKLYGSVLETFDQLQLQASGGVRDIADLRTLRDQGLPAAITGRAILDGRITAEEIRSFLRDE